jgi:hypothetical protein
MLAGAACSGGEEPVSAPPSSPTASATQNTESPSAAPEVRVTAKVGEVNGRIPPKTSEATAQEIGQLVDDWFEAAYLGGRYPRARFRDFPAFTPGAAERAGADAALMTNKAIGRQVRTVAARQKAVTVDLLARNDRAVAATARFTLRFDTTGVYAKQVTVKGRLFLTRNEKRQWRVFGYDVVRSAR